ncbi:MAG: pyruvate dehydrogenase (acetyl-transferring), homodimeric type [Acidimicrobiia bacterium]
MSADGFVYQLPDRDPDETREWLESLDAVIDAAGTARARYLLMRLLDRAANRDVGLSAAISTPYVNTIPPEAEPWFPGDEHLERRIRAYVRWNAVAMVDRANHRYEGLGGHLSTYASAAALYEVGFNHFFHGKEDGGHGDQVFIQGHAAPGIYARAYLERRLTEEQLDAFRREVGGNGLPSYPHPRRLPHFWEFPTVSMGLSPLNAVAQARINRYLLHHQLADTSESTVWCFVGDGEMDEPEAKAGLSIAAREQLDNLIFVVNCNLQRLDGPVRGGGKIIQELEMAFRGAGWNVIKVIWGREWDALLKADVDGVLVRRMNETVDGDFQKYATESGAYIREHFFGPDPRLRAMVAHLSDEELERLPRGGHDYRKLYAAFDVAVKHRGSPTVILAKTIKGWTLGASVEARNATHQVKKLTAAELKTFRDRLHLDVSDDELSELAPYLHPGTTSPEYEYLTARRRMLNGPLPSRQSAAPAIPPVPHTVYEEFHAGTGPKLTASTTTAFARLIRKLLADPELGPRVVPIIPDEARTFGLDALFSDVKIYAPFGQPYEPVDAGLLLSYRESREGRVLEEGISEAGSMASFTAVGTAYATWGQPLVPFFVFYSMFGFQRVGDLIWSFGDQRGRGFLLGATAGRTTLTGEGLQHCDGQSQLLASAMPNCRTYDPAFAYEVAVIVEDGLARMYGPEPQDCFYYLTLYNENVAMPAMPVGVEDGIVRGLYRYREAEAGTHRAQILASGMMMNDALEAQRILTERYDVRADVWSATSYKLLREDALECERWNRLHPTETPRTPYVRQQLDDGCGPIVGVTDYLSLVPDQISRFVGGPFVALGTDGYGLSDTRVALRRHFEVDTAHIVVAVLHQLTTAGSLDPRVVTEAIRDFEIDPETAPPRVSDPTG